MADSLQMMFLKSGIVKVFKTVHHRMDESVSDLAGKSDNTSARPLKPDVDLFVIMGCSF